MSHETEELDQAIEDVMQVIGHACEELTPGGSTRNGQDGHRDGLGLVRRVGALQERLAAAAARLRRTQARALRDDGLTTDRIAELFGVSRQRVSALLKDPSRSSVARSTSA